MFFCALTFLQAQNLTTTRENLPSSRFDVKKASIEKLEVAPVQKSIIDELMSHDNKGELYRVATHIPIDVSIANSGNIQTLSNGGQLWQTKISAKGSLATVLLFDYFNLPEGAEMYVYCNNTDVVFGPYTRGSNPQGEAYAIGIIPDDEVTVEYYVPAGIAMSENDFKIAHFDYFFRGGLDGELSMIARVTGARATSYGSSESCEVNVNCAEGANWQTQKKGSCLVYVVASDGAGFCSGSLINNTAQDGTPYVLTADHCGEGSATVSAGNWNSWMCYFNFEAPSCTNAQPTNTVSFTGVTKKARGNMTGGTDFLLIQMNNATTTAIKNAGLVYNGWDRTGTAPSSGVSIHHPAGDITKISTFKTALATASYTGCAASSHWRVYWSQTTDQGSTKQGVTEGGSSGSPIFNGANKFIVGTLTGGSSYCATPNSPDLYGKFSSHWDNTANGSSSAYKLAPWLDPSSTGVTTLSWYDPNAVPTNPIDVQLTSITSPVSGQNLTSAETVTVSIKNNGTNALTSMTLAYYINDVQKQSVAWTGNLASTATTTYSFSTKADLSAAGTYPIKVVATVASDANTADNTITQSVTNTICGITTFQYTQNFENGDDCWTWDKALSTNTNQLGIYSGTTTSGSFTIPSTNAGATGGSYSFVFSSYSPGFSSYNQYLFSPEISAGTDSVKITFYYRKSSSSGSESFRVGSSTTTKTVASFGNWTANVTNASNTAWTSYTKTFAPGTKYICINYNVTSDQYHLYIDYVTIAQVYATVPTTPGCGTVTMANWEAGTTASNPVPTSTCQGTANVSYSYSGRNTTTYGPSATKPTAAGDYTVTATFAANATYMQHTATANFTITPSTAEPFICDGIDTELDNFTPYLDSLRIYLSTNGGMLSGPNGYGDLGKFEKITFPNNGKITDIYYAVTHAATTTGSVTLKIYDNNQTTVLYSQSMATSSITSDDYDYVTLSTPIDVTVGQTVYVGFEWASSYPLTDSFAVYQVISTAIPANTAYEIWDNNSWNDMSDAWWGSVRKTSLLMGVYYCAEETEGGACEGFDNLSLSNTTGYSTGSFTGANAIVWNYTAAQKANNSNTNYPINGSGVILRRTADNSNVTSDSISGGCGTLTLNYRKAYTGIGNRNFAIYVNGQSVYTSPNFGNASGASATVYPVSVDVNVAGKFVIKVANTSANQLTIDDICWTPYTAVEPFICNGIGTELDNFTPYLDSLTLYNVNGGGYVSGPNTYGDLGKFEKITFPSNGMLTDIYFAAKHAATTTGSVTLKVYADDQSTSLFSQTFATSAIQSMNYNTYSLPNPIAVTANQSIYVGFEWASSYPLTDSFAILQVTSNAISTGTAYEIYNGTWYAFSDSWNFSNTSLLVGVNYCAEAAQDGCGTVTLADWVYAATPAMPQLASTCQGTAGVTISYLGRGETVYVESTTVPENVGTYTVKAVFPATANYTTYTATDDFEITKKNITKPTLVANSFVYDGGPKTVVLTPTNAAYSLGGTYTATNVGDYDALAILTDTANTQWAGGTITNVTLPWAITIANGCGTVTLADWGEWEAPKTPIVSSNCQGTANVTFTYVGVAPTEYTESSTVPSAAGTYKVIAHFPATINYTAVDAEAEFEIISSSVATVDLNADAISIYPNPVTNFLYIDGRRTVGDGKKLLVEIFDINGKQLSTMSYDVLQYPTKINCVDLKPGAYFLKIDEKVFKFIKK
ncbi:hypothetical protein FACS1894178_0710 [Bacteroidia bacterium]|nr:hypothetical protein FACS1894178_0710 [Bacteroidia bacterium]